MWRCLFSQRCSFPSILTCFALMTCFNLMSPIISLHSDCDKALIPVNCLLFSPPMCLLTSLHCESFSPVLLHQKLHCTRPIISQGILPVSKWIHSSILLQARISVCQQCHSSLAAKFLLKLQVHFYSFSYLTKKCGLLMAFNLKMYPLGSVFADFILKFNQMNEYSTKKNTWCYNCIFLWDDIWLAWLNIKTI